MNGVLSSLLAESIPQILITTPTEQEESATSAESASNDYLKAHELNYAFPDVINDTNDNRTSDSYETSYNMGLESKWKKHTGDDDRNSELQDDKWWIVEGITCDLVSYYGKGNCLFYRATAGQFANPTAEKSFAEFAEYLA